MKKITLVALLILGCQIIYADNLESTLQSIYYQQSYCDKATPPDSITFLKQNTNHAANYCSYMQEYDPGNYSKQYKKLVEKANKNPAEYGYLVALANINSAGTPGDHKKAEKWLKKSVSSGSDKARIVYAVYLLSINECNAKNQEGKCRDKAKKLLESVDNSMANSMLAGLFPDNLKLTCKYAEKAFKQGSYNTYPTVVACQTDDFQKTITPKMKQNLNKVISDKNTSIVVKTQAAKLLGNSKELKLLDAIK